MKIAFNTMFKNEEILLKEILPIWQTYPVDLFIFYNDNSTDLSVDVVKNILPKNRFIIINDRLPKFHESYQRQRMLEIARNEDIDYVFCIDCDELLTSNIINDFDNFIKMYETHDVMLYWYNIVESIDYYRTDPQYINNYRTFVLPLKYTANLNKDDWKYHTPRTPYINLPKLTTKEYGIIHLQAMNRKFYAIKQLWYKHYEHFMYNHSIDFINARYDIVVNKLEFQPQLIDKKLIENININSNIFDGMEIKYLEFIKNNYKKELITFGEEYL